MLAKYLTGLLKPYEKTVVSRVSETSDFAYIIKPERDETTVSFDVTSLHTNVPLRTI